MLGQNYLDYKLSKLFKEEARGGTIADGVGGDTVLVESGKWHDKEK